MSVPQSPPTEAPRRHGASRAQAPAAGPWAGPSTQHPRGPHPAALRFARSPAPSRRPARRCARGPGRTPALLRQTYLRAAWPAPAPPLRHAAAGPLPARQTAQQDAPRPPSWTRPVAALSCRAMYLWRTLFSSGGTGGGHADGGAQWCGGNAAQAAGLPLGAAPAGWRPQRVQAQTGSARGKCERRVQGHPQPCGWHMAPRAAHARSQRRVPPARAPPHGAPGP
jgi:hypothetical protein